MSLLFRRIYQSVYIQRNVCLNGLSASFLYAEDPFLGPDTGFLPHSFLLCAVSLYPGNEALETGLEEEKKRMKNEVRDQWGSGRCDPGKHSLKHLRKQSPGRPGGATQNQCLCPPWRTLAEHKH